MLSHCWGTLESPGELLKYTDMWAPPPRDSDFIGMVCDQARVFSKMFPRWLKGSQQWEALQDCMIVSQAPWVSIPLELSFSLSLQSLTLSKGLWIPTGCIVWLVGSNFRRFLYCDLRLLVFWWCFVLTFLSGCFCVPNTGNLSFCHFGCLDSCSSAALVFSDGCSLKRTLLASNSGIPDLLVGLISAGRPIHESIRVPSSAQGSVQTRKITSQDICFFF